MSMVTEIALANMKYHKSKNILTGIAIFLTTLLLFLVPTIGMDLINSQKAAVNELYPTWHALFRNVSEDTATKIASHHLVEKYGLRSDLGYVAADDANIAMIYLDAQAVEMYKLDISEGRLPEAENEIVVSKGILEELSLSGEIGDTVTIPYQVYRNGSLDFIQKKDFVICGFLPDTEINKEQNSYTSLVAKAFLNEEILFDEIVYRFLFQIDTEYANDTEKIEESIQQLAEQFGIFEQDYRINEDYLWANYVEASAFDGDREGIIGVPESGKELLENGIIEGNVTYEELKSGDKVIIDKNLLYWYPELKIGDVFDVLYWDGDKECKKQLEIVAIADYSLGFTSFHYLIMAEEGLHSFSDHNLNMYYRIFADKKYDADVEAKLKALVEENGRIEMDTWKAHYDEWNSAMTLTRGACYAFLGILGAICIMNMINTMIHSVHVRKKEIGMLQAIGMSDLQLLKMLQFEGLFYTFGTLIVAVGGGSVAGYPVFLWAKDHGMFNIRNYHYPLSATLVMIAVLVFVQVILVFVIGKSVKKDSLIDRIRFDN